MGRTTHKSGTPPSEQTPPEEEKVKVMVAKEETAQATKKPSKPQLDIPVEQQHINKTLKLIKESGDVKGKFDALTSGVLRNEFTSTANQIKQVVGVLVNMDTNASNKVLSFLRVIKKSLELDIYPKSKLNMDIILIGFNSNKDVLTETRLFRELNANSLSVKEMTTFENLLNVLISTCDPKTKAKNLKAINIKTATHPNKTTFTPKGTENIIRYYNQ